jgi:small subunit ribosomal protein S6
LLNFEADAATVSEFDRLMGLNEDVLRSLIIAIEAVDPEPSIMMQNKTERSGSDASDDASAA